jgi:hypothetical protein
MGSICLELLNPAAARCPSIDVDSEDGWAVAGALFEPNWLKRIE